MSWIKTVTNSPEDSTEKWEGRRNMVELGELVKKFYYHPLTKGSNSIKKVLPAILQESQFLQARYSKPVYGSSTGIESKNYQNWQWIKTGADEVVIDPYK